MSTLGFPSSFLWGAATAAHQVEGGNVLNDVWAAERLPGSPFAEPSGDACDSFHRYGEDIAIVAEAGLGSYRFSLDWGRIQPAEGEISRSSLDHYRRMIDACHTAGVQPMVTLHHFASPHWLVRQGGWTSSKVVDLFGNFCEAVLPVLQDVPLVCTINELNVLWDFCHLLTEPQASPRNPAARDCIIAGHRRAVEILRGGSACEVGMTLAIPGFDVLPGGEDNARAWALETIDVFLDATEADDFVGVQTYTDTVVGPGGVIEPGPGDDVLPQIGWRFRPEALGSAVRRTYGIVGKPIYVTENGIATSDDTQRVAYVRRALASLHAAMQDGVDVRGYFYWSLLDNFEWLLGYGPTFGLVDVDRTSFQRCPKPSATWYGQVARSGVLDLTEEP